MLKLVLILIFFSMIFVLIGSIDPAYATAISDKLSCEGIGGVWVAATSTCILSTSYTVTTGNDLEINSGVTLEINSGVTLDFEPDSNLKNFGNIINNGIITLTGLGSFQGGIISNRDTASFTNFGTINLTGGSGQGTGSIFNQETAMFTNSGTINLIGGSGTYSGSLRMGGTSTFTNTNTITVTGNTGIQSGYIGIMKSSEFINSGFIDITGGSGKGSGLFDNWDSGIVANSGSLIVTGNDGENSGHVANMGTSSFANNGIITIIGGAGINSGVMINNDNAKFSNFKTIIITTGGPFSDSGLKNGGSSTFTNRGDIKSNKNLINKASLNNFETITIGNNFNNQGNTINNCGTITINGILIGNSIMESKCGNSVHHHDPTIGKTRWGFQVVENGICIDITCWTVTADYHQDFELVEMLSDSTHTISTTIYCHNGVAKCNYVAFGVSPYGTNINDSVWKVILQKDHNDNWTMTVIDPESYLGDVTSTTQIVNDEKQLAASINALFKKPTPGMILNVEVRDSSGGYRDFKFNDGIAIKDAYAYPSIDTFYEPPLEIEPLCLNENANKRYTCAFDKVKEWTIKNAEAKLQQIINE